MYSATELCSVLGFHFAICPTLQLLAVTSAGSLLSNPQPWCLMVLNGLLLQLPPV